MSALIVLTIIEKVIKIAFWAILLLFAVVFLYTVCEQNNESKEE